MEITKNAKIIIIDAQKDFTHPAGLYASKHPGITQILAAKNQVNHLLASLDKEKFVIIRSDYQPGQFEQGVSMCIAGTTGNQLDINVDNHFNIFTKTAHSSFSSPDFKAYAKASGINTLILSGFLAEYCVKQTALDALQEDYQVYLLTDCIGTGDDVQSRMDSMLLELTQKGAKLLHSKELL
ncbi:cysteine hydrolase family protein [Chitinophaga arvensicola]|uniref:Nicotinamidase-related amidase n=1 Tax=Chitinophaga arvensicola TaxID=29529 RepID=A0A1I0R7Q0_9BACT|nr:isochorismatase family cysteine hydrolase [Chitinophaga arvensicola]SEW36781.1 Nicotinamidase-related amidase [Chitinophaga arvensicola]